MKWCFLALMVFPFALQAQEDEVTNGRIRDLLDRANIFLGGDPAASRTLADSAYRLAERMGNKELMGQAKRVEGLVHYTEGAYDRAYQELTKGLDLCEQSGSPSCMAILLNEIGTLEKKNGAVEKSKATFQRAFQLAREGVDSMQMGNSLNNLGIVYDITGLPDSARMCFFQSITYKEAVGDQVGLSYNYDNLGMVAAKQGAFAESESFFLKAAAIRKKLNNKQSYAIILNNLAELKLMENKPVEALAYLNQALPVALQADYRDFISHIYLMMHEAHLLQNDSSGALTYYKKHVALKDSLFNVARSQQLAELQTQYETEKKERQIVIQEAEITKQKTRNRLNMAAIGGLTFIVVLLSIIVLLIRSRARKKQALLRQEAEVLMRDAQLEAALSSQEKERTRFAKDLHDGFGQMISLLNLNLKSLETGGSDRMEIFEKSSEVLDQMYLELKGICFNLMPQTLIQHGIGPAVREFADRVNRTDQLFVAVDLFGMEGRLTEIQEISLYRISQEWVNNIMKYSDADKVTVQITRDRDEITLLIEDNGSGFDHNLLKDGTGNGWKNMNSRINLIKGELEIDTTPGIRGNTLIVNAPALVGPVMKSAAVLQI